MPNDTAWPRKTRELCNHHMDSTIWNDFRFRDDDIIIATYAKSGTTWMQQIIGQLLSGGAEDVNVGELSPWLDLRIPPKAEKLPMVEAQTQRRFLKTHLPVDALVFDPRARYIFVGRDGRDVVWSLHNHFVNANADFYAALNDTPGRVGPPVDRPPADTGVFFREWLEGDGYPLWSFWENVESWWAIRELPNVKLVHFNDLKADLAGGIADIADFLDIAIAPDRHDAIVAHCSFDYMKAHAENAAPLGGIFWEGGAQTFIHKGNNGRWRDTLTDADNARYLAMARERLGEDCAHWLETGERHDRSG